MQTQTPFQVHVVEVTVKCVTRQTKCQIVTSWCSINKFGEKIQVKLHSEIKKQTSTEGFLEIHFSTDLTHAPEPRYARTF